MYKSSCLLHYSFADSTVEQRDFALLEIDQFTKDII